MSGLPPKVLVVDDVELNRSLLRRITEHLGFQAVECRTGTEALQAFANHAESIQCVLMDINMPEMDGLEAAWRIRQLEAKTATSKSQHAQEQLPRNTSDADILENHRGHVCQSQAAPKAVPIWAISACTDDEQLQSPVLSYLSSQRESGPLWQRVGMNAFLSKPVNVRELLGKLEALGYKSQQRAETNRSPIPCHELEAREGKGLKRRCSSEAPSSAFAKRATGAQMPPSLLMVASKAVE